MSKNVYDETVETLKADVDSLKKKYGDNISKGDYRSAMECMKLLKSSLELIKEYDWHLEYSQYLDVTDDVYKVSIWEQNQDGRVRNIKTWNTDGKCISNTDGGIINTYKTNSINIDSGNISGFKFSTDIE